MKNITLILSVFILSSCAQISTYIKKYKEEARKYKEYIAQLRIDGKCYIEDYDCSYRFWSGKSYMYIPQTCQHEVCHE